MPEPSLTLSACSIGSLDASANRCSTLFGQLIIPPLVTRNALIQSTGFGRQQTCPESLVDTGYS
jgi:hypothetical protein